MIKFFRKIRQNIIRETLPARQAGKVSKPTSPIGRYLLYALGEILLVVIGILLALQINNVNENRKAHIKSKKYLAEILKDLRSDTTSINSSINFCTAFIESEKWALNKIDFAHQDADSLWITLGGFYASVDLHDRTFQKIQNSGESSLRGFDAVFDRLTHYYTKTYTKYSQYSNWDRKVILEGHFYMQELYDQIEISNYRTALLGRETGVRAFPLVNSSPKQIDNLIEFVKSPRGRNHVRNNYVRHLRGITVFEDTKAEAIDLASEIKNVLKAK